MLPARGNREISPARGRNIRALLPETEIRTGPTVIRKGVRVLRHRPDRNPALTRDHSAPFARDFIQGSAGEQPELVWYVDRWIIKSGTARRGERLAGLGQSRLFRDPGYRQPLPAEEEVRHRQLALHLGEPDRRQDHHRADRPASMHSPARRQRQLPM